MLLALSLALVARADFSPQEPVRAFVGARIFPVSGPVIERGTLLIQGDKVLAVGANVSVPNGAVTVDCAGKTILPGLVDTHSHVGGGAGGDSSSPIQPDARIADSINPRHPGFKRALAGGITTINIMPGSGHLMSGQTLYVKNRAGARIVDDLMIRDVDGWVFGGLKMANGTNPIGEPPFPGTRAKSMALARERFLKAQEYKAKRDKAAKGEGTAPDRDLGMEAMVEALEGRRIVQHHTHRADDIISVLRLQKEFGFKLVLQHVSEAWKVADEIAEAKVPCSIIVLDTPGGKQEAVDIDFRNGGDLERKGVTVAIHTDDGITDSRLLLRSAALAVRGGMTRSAAVRSLTLDGAKMLGLDSRLGSLAVGKDADFVVLSGDPFSIYTKVLETWVDGKKAFDRNDPKDRLFAVGGFGAGREQDTYLCCEGGH